MTLLWIFVLCLSTAATEELALGLCELSENLKRTKVRGVADEASQSPRRS